jgi:hypothetical protein
MERRREVFIGGTAYDRGALLEHLFDLPRRILVVTGDGRGAEKDVRTHAPRLGLELLVPPSPDVERQIVDLYVQALYGGVLVLVGEGFRVRRARQMLARSNGWPTEVIEL